MLAEIVLAPTLRSATVRLANIIIVIPIIAVARMLFGVIMSLLLDDRKKWMA